jgi:hypothetical protein
VKGPTKPRFGVGAIGPTKTTGWISPSEEDPVARNMTVVGWQVVGLVGRRSEIFDDGDHIFLGIP